MALNDGSQMAEIPSFIVLVSVDGIQHTRKTCYFILFDNVIYKEIM